jgi:CheY-like chemotaxis protein
MDGYRLAGEMRARPATADALLIAVTGYGQAHDRQRSKEAGFDHHLVKPVAFEEIQRAVSDRFT